MHTRTIACVTRERCEQCCVLFTHTVAYKGIAVACERNSLKASLQLFLPTHLTFAILAATRLRKRKKIVTNCASPSFPLAFQLCLFFNWTLSESQILRNVRIWFSRLLFQSDKLVNCEWRICLVLHSSRLLSLTIDAKSKIVLTPFTLFPCSCNEKSIGRSTPRSPWGCRRRPSSSCTCRDSRTSCLLQFSRNDPSLPRLEPAGCASPTPWTKQPPPPLSIWRAVCRLSQTQLRYCAKPLSRVTVDVTLFRLSHEPDMSVPKCSITTVCRFCQRTGVLQLFSPILCRLPREAFTHRNCYSQGFWALLVHFSFSFSPSRSMVSSWSGRNNAFTLWCSYLKWDERKLEPSMTT